MERIQIDTGRLKDGTNQIRDQLAIMRREAALLYDEAAELNAMWTGPANSAFNAQFANDRMMLSEICNGLEHYIRELNEAVVDYNRCEGEVADMVASIRI